MKKIISLFILICMLFLTLTVSGCQKKSVIEPSGHNMGAWQLEKQATYKEKGMLIRKCLDAGCDYYEKHSIKAASGLTYTEEDGKVYLSGVGKFDGSFLYVASTTKSGKKIDGIALGAFSDDQNLKYVYVEDGIDEIGGYAFSGCTSLLSARLPDNVGSMEVGVFMGCDLLYSVHLPESIKAIPASCFNNCISLKNVNIPEKTEQIAESAFNLCRALTEIQLPEGLKRIESNAFADCAALASPVFPQSLEVIGFSAFAGCLSFKKIVLPAELKALYDCAFTACTGLERVFLPSTIAEIYAPYGLSPFWHCAPTTVLATNATMRPEGWGEYFAVYDSYSDNAPETYQSLEVIYNTEE